MVRAIAQRTMDTDALAMAAMFGTNRNDGCGEAGPECRARGVAAIFLISGCGALPASRPSSANCHSRRAQQSRSIAGEY